MPYVLVWTLVHKTTPALDTESRCQGYQTRRISSGDLAWVSKWNYKTSAESKHRDTGGKKEKKVRCTHSVSVILSFTNRHKCLEVNKNLKFYSFSLKKKAYKPVYFALRVFDEGTTKHWWTQVMSLSSQWLTLLCPYFTTYILNVWTFHWTYGPVIIDKSWLKWLSHWIK